MSNKKPVMTVVIKEGHKLSLNEFCSIVANAVIWFVDEVESGYTQAKHEVALKNWELTGQKICIRSASEDQWWNFLMADGMTERIDDIQFHVIPPMPALELPEFVRYCPEYTGDFVDDLDTIPKETGIRLPLLSVVMEKQKKVPALEYAHRAVSVAKINLEMSKAVKFGYDEWARNNFAINVGIVDSLDYISPAKIMIGHTGGSRTDAIGLWVD